jgi:hypothetical protein
MEGRHATGELERFSAPLSGVLPNLSFARNLARETHSPAPGMATSSGRGSRRRAAYWSKDKNSRTDQCQDFPGMIATRRADQTRPATRISLRPHDPSTGEEIEREEVVKGYEYQRGQSVTFTAEELKALDVESSKVIDLEKFVPRGDIDPVYFDSPYYLYPDGPIAVEALRVIGAAMAEAGVVGLGRLTLSRRERMVLVEPGTGMALFTLRAAKGVTARGLTGSPFISYRDRYQDALRERGLPRRWPPSRHRARPRRDRTAMPETVLKLTSNH